MLGNKGKGGMKGSNLFRKYRFIKVLNEGEFSTVFLVEHRKMECLRVIKRISKQCLHYERLMTEADILKALRHPNIPIMYDVEEDADYSYIVEEYVAGESLRAFRSRQAHIQEDVIVDIVSQICTLFQLLHSGDNPILYLDLKPDNVIVSHGRIKLIDFGASIYLNEIGKREESFGTRGYSAPEQYGIQWVDPRSDIYGVGAILYFLITGTSFSEQSIRNGKMDAEGAYSPALKKVTLKCLRKNPNQRYQRVEDLVAALDKQRQTLPLKKPLTIAVAGTKEGMGASHVGLLLASYINRYQGGAVYVECNGRKVLPSILKRQKKWRMDGRTVTVGHCRMWPSDDWNEAYMTEPVAYVMDYGVARPEHKEAFERADHILIVAGGKEWEYGDTAKCMAEFFEYKDIVYVLNHVDARQARTVADMWKGVEWVAAPHWPNPYRVDSTLRLRGFVEGVLKEKANAKGVVVGKKKGWVRKRSQNPGRVRRNP